MSYFNATQIEFGDNFAIDAFGRLRVSEPDTLWDSKLLTDKAALFWDESLGGSGSSTYVGAGPHVAMAVSGNGDSVIRQTFQRFNYQPGKSQLFLITGVFTAPTAQVTWQVGPYDGVNGIYLYSDGTTVGLSVSNNSSDDNYDQADWNIDTMDGNGPSGITLDFDKAQILWIDFEWLGVGRIRAGFVIDGIIYYCHEWLHANVVTAGYTPTPNYPVRYAIQSTGGSATMKAICSSCASEGGQEDTGIVRAVSMGTAVLGGTTAGTRYALVGIALAAANQDRVCLQESVTTMVTSNANYLWELRLNPTVTGTFVYGALANSPMTFAIGAGATVAGGTVLAQGYVASSQRSAEDDLKSSRWLGADIAGTSDTLVLCAIPTQNNTNLVGGISWRELS
jgi:hypothetical protein